MAKRPIHDVFDLLGRRWAMRIVWELRRDALGFSELRGRCGLSPSVLTTRLAELGAAGVIAADPSGRYTLTVSGRELSRVLFDLNRWAESAGRGGETLSSTE